MAYNIITPNSVGSALQTLLFSNTQLEDTLSNLSSGLVVASAKDDAGYWSTANSLKSDESIITSVGDALNLSESTVNTAYTALKTVIEQLSSLSKSLITAAEPSADRSQISSAVESTKKTLQVAIESAQFSGTNWLYNNQTNLSGTNSFVASFQRTASGTVQLTTQGIPAADTVLADTQDASRGLLTNVMDASKLNDTGSTTPRNYYLLNVNSASGVSGTEIAVSDTTTDEQLADMRYVVDNLMGSVTKIAARVGEMLNRISAQSDFANDLSDTLQASVSRLVDANMEEVSVRKTAAKVQADLAAEVVSLANTNMQKLLKIFG